MTNYWLWLFLIFIPILVFAAKPETSPRFCMGRLLLAIVLGYISLNMALYVQHISEQQAYDMCQKQFADGDHVMHAECGTPFIGNAAQKAFYAILGWLLAGAYTGVWEWAWRKKYRHALPLLKRNWLGTLLIGMAAFCFILYPLCMAVSWLIILILYQ